ncbi:MAG: glutamyl-tRNA reductase [Ilumatobacteraceae bacterium]|jgi:glutamyl-tRNA reductase|nr:glutamyl-tRNA reductase [Ilumatobacteraceae bacterium]
MSLLVVGVNHRSGSVALLERLAIAPADLGKAVASLARRDSVREVAVISTCNRTEVYAVTERFHGAYADIREFLCELGSFHADELHPHLFSQHDEAAIAHLFEVAAGLDSIVVGEHEILGQVRDAWEVAQTEGGARTTLNLVFRHALAVGKRVRSETAIGRGTTSVSHAAVEMATDALGGVVGREVLVVGAGQMGDGIAMALHRAGVASITVANRSPERGAELAARVAGRAIGFDGLAAAIATADVVLTCTGAGTPLLGVDDVVDRAGRPLLVVDIAVPRDVDHAVGSLPDVTLLDLDDLRAWAQRGEAQRMAEAELVRAMVREEIDRFEAEATALQAAPLVAALRARAEEIRVAELARLERRLGRLDDAQRAAVEALTRGIVQKLLHGPSVLLREQAGTPQGERNAAAVADLFDLH